MEKQTAIVVSATFSALLLFGFYSSTMNYAYAIDLFQLTFTNPTFGNVTGVTYRSDNDKWFFTSSINNTVIQVNGNTNTVDTSFGTGTCANPQTIHALVDFAYLAIVCDATVRINSAIAPFGIINATTACGNYDRIVEWQQENRLYLSVDQNKIICWIDADCFGVICSPATLTGIIDLTVPCSAEIYDIAIDQARNRLWLTCGNEVVAVDLTVSAPTIQTTVANSLSGITYNIVNDKLIVVGYAAGVSDVYVLNANTGVLENTIPMNIACHAIDTNQGTKFAYIACFGDNSLKVFDVLALAIESTSATGTFDSGAVFGSTNTIPEIVFAENEATGYFPYDSNKGGGVFPTQNFVGGFMDGEPTSTDPNQIFCSNPANANILICRLEAQGNTGLSGTSQLLNQSSTNLLCQVGVLKCMQDPTTGNFIPDNPDVKTNGVGYIITIVSMGILIGLFWVASHGSLTDIPTFVWFIGVMGILGGLTAIEYIDPTFLIIGVISVVGFAVAKVKGVFSGSELFKGESI